GGQAADQVLVLGAVGALVLHPAGGQLVAVPDRRRQQAVAQVGHKEGQGRRAAHQGEGGGLVGLRVQEGDHRLEQGRRAGQGRQGLIGGGLDQAQQAVPQDAVGHGQGRRQQQQVGPQERSEERRVGKEWRSRWAADQ